MSASEPAGITYAMAANAIFSIHTQHMKDNIWISARDVIDYKKAREEARKPFERNIPKTRQELWDREKEGWTNACLNDLAANWTRVEGRIDPQAFETMYMPGGLAKEEEQQPAEPVRRMPRYGVDPATGIQMK